MQLVTDSSMDSDETSCDADSSWVYESESSDGSTRLNRNYSSKKKKRRKFNGTVHELDGGDLAFAAIDQG